MASHCHLWGVFLAASFVFRLTWGTANNGILNNAIQDGPEFTDIIENITVPAGRTVKLACSVKNLGPYKVAWMHFEQSAILTVHNHVITRNPRISVTHDKHDKHKTWFLHISNVQEEDKGRYMCQINTVTAKTQFGYLHVVVPPNIDDSGTSASDITVPEGVNVTLHCKATGSPKPSIKWRREDAGGRIRVNNVTTVKEVEGEVLQLINLNRTDMGKYLCIASNTVPPAVSKQFKVYTEFPPKITIPQALIGAPVGSASVSLVCNIELYPTSSAYWSRDDVNHSIIQNDSKYKTEIVNLNSTYNYTMILTVANFENADEGLYRCFVNNSMGHADGVVRLYPIQPPTTIPPSTTVTTTRQVSTTRRTTSTTSDPTIPNGQTPTVHLIDSKGTKYQSSDLNEIDRYEKSASASASAAESAKGLDWPQEDNKHNDGRSGSGNVNRGIMTGILITIGLGILF